MVRFWSAIVFREGGYWGRPLEAHAALGPLTPYHFERWLARFAATLDARFHGPNADRMKRQATRIAGVLQLRLGIAPAVGV